MGPLLNSDTGVGLGMGHHYATNQVKAHKILLIEDNEYVREAFELVLQSSGFTAHAVATAEEGLTAVRRKRYDIIICDYRLPGMDGLEFFMKAKLNSPKSTNVLISAYGFQDIVKRAKAAGVHQFYEKPFSIQSVLNRVVAVPAYRRSSTESIGRKGEKKWNDEKSLTRLQQRSDHF